MSENTNAASLASFDAFVSEMKRGIKRQYDRSVNKDLSQQNWQGLFQRNVTGVLQQCYADALKKLRQLPFQSGGTELATQALQPFDGFMDELLAYSLQKHRTTCAISNFPDEHNPSDAYLSEVLAQTRKDWDAFSAEVSTCLSAGASSGH
jgi:hypothetical protein